MKKSVDSKFDLLKLALSVLVVLAHVNMQRREIFPWIAVVVPLYFLMTSYFLFRKIMYAGSKREKRTIIRAFILRTVKLYCFWFVLLIPLTLYNHRSMQFGSGSTGFVEHALKRLFFGSTYQSSWFLTASLFGVAIVGKLSERLSNRVLMVMSIGVFVFVTLWHAYQPFFPEGSAVRRFCDFYYRAMSNPHHSFPVALVWITAGKCFAEGTFSLKKRLHVPLLILSCLLLYAEWLFVEYHTGFYAGEVYLMVLPAALSLFALLLNILPFQITGSVYLKRCSTYIYVLHGTLLPSVQYLVRQILHWERDAAVLLVDVLICCVIYIIAQTIMNRRKNRLTAILRYSY